MAAEGFVYNTELARQFKNKYNISDEDAVRYAMIVSSIGVGRAIKGNNKNAVSKANSTIESSQGERPANLTPNGAGRSSAFNQAKRDAGIPTSMQPAKVVPNTDKRSNNQPGKQYIYEVPKSGGGTKTVIIRDDSKGHVFLDDPAQNRGSHFNTPNGDHYDY